MTEDPDDLNGYDVVTDDAGALGYGNDAVDAGRRVVRVAQNDTPRKKKKKKRPPKPTRKLDKAWKAESSPAGSHAPTTHIYILFYFPWISSNFSIEDFLGRLHGTSDPARYAETSPFIAAGIDIVVKKSSDQVWTDLGSALHESGAFVIYWGHSLLSASNHRAEALRPEPDPDDASADITLKQLKSLLPTLNAKAFVVAACSTDQCIGKVKRDTVIITTDSGKDYVTNSIDWSNALEQLLKKFVDGKSLEKCVDAANVSFAASSDPDDKFVVVSGDSAMTSTT